MRLLQRARAETFFLSIWGVNGTVSILSTSENSRLRLIYEGSALHRRNVDEQEVTRTSLVLHTTDTTLPSTSALTKRGRYRTTHESVDLFEVRVHEAVIEPTP